MNAKMNAKMNAQSITYAQLGYNDAVHGFEELAGLSANAEYLAGYREGEASIEEFGYLSENELYLMFSYRESTTNVSYKITTNRRS